MHKFHLLPRFSVICGVVMTLAACAGTSFPDKTPAETAASQSGSLCSASSEPTVNITSAGVKFVRTPDACFAGLPDWPYAPRYVDIDGLRQAYVDEGPANGPVVLLLHGQPSWSYLYRKMIPVLANAGFRVIAMDHLGMGRSDKPIDIAAYSYLGHNDRLLRFIEQLDLRNINLFVQDWGSLIGLRVAGLNPERFARIAVANGALPMLPAGYKPYPAVVDPDQIENIKATYAIVPAQQPLFYKGCQLRVPVDPNYFAHWMKYAMKSPSFRPSETLEALTWFDMPNAEAAAYDAPFPNRIYMAGVRKFPSLINELGGTTDGAWEGLRAFNRPFLTLWAANDPGNLGSCAAQQIFVDAVPGAKGQPHDRLPNASHFIQDDQGPELAKRLVTFFSK